MSFVNQPSVFLGMVGLLAKIESYFPPFLGVTATGQKTNYNPTDS